MSLDVRSPTGSAGLAAGVAEVLATARQITNGDALAAEVTALRDRFDGPFRVAIAGRVKAGKSTLLNAFVGERLAPTDAGECTRIVTTYVEGLGYDVTAVLRSGARERLPFAREGGALTIDLGGRDPDGIEQLEVAWPSSALHVLTLIDTPGLASLDDRNSVRTRDFLALDEGRSSQADAVIYLMRHVHRSDVEFLDGFLDRTVGNVSPVNAIGVLSRADEIGAARPDAMVSAGRIAERYRLDDQIRALCSTVVPVAGLLAETGLTLREDEAASLQDLAALDEPTVATLLLTADHFVTPALDVVDVDAREALLGRFGMFGLRIAIAAFRDGTVHDAAELSAMLVQVSGLGELRRLVIERLMPRAVILKARVTLAGLRDLATRFAARDPAGADRIVGAIERLEARSHEFAELRMAHLALSGSLQFGTQELAEVDRVTRDGPAAARLDMPADAAPADIRTVCLAAIERWRSRAEDPLADPLTADAARTLARTYEGIHLSAGLLSAGSPLARTAAPGQVN